MTSARRDGASTLATSNDSTPRSDHGSTSDRPALPALPSRWRTSGEALLLRLLVLAVFLVVWSLLLGLGVTTEFWISKPVSVAQRLVEYLVTERSIYRHLAATIAASVSGLAVGGLGGVATGFAIAKWRRLRIALDPYIMGIYSLPRVALAPLFILWFGIGPESKVMLAGFVSYFVLLINTHVGARNVDADLLAAVRTMGGTERYLFRKVIVPGSTPWILSGFRIGLGLALTGAVVTEMLGSQSGIGWLIARSSGVFDTTGTFASLTVLAITAMALNGSMKRIEAWLLRWQGDTVL